MDATAAPRRSRLDAVRRVFDVLTYAVRWNSTEINGELQAAGLNEQSGPAVGVLKWLNGRAESRQAELSAGTKSLFLEHIQAGAELLGMEPAAVRVEEGTVHLSFPASAEPTTGGVL